MTDYALVTLRDLARKMIVLEAKARAALAHGDDLRARQLWFQRVQISTERSAKLREYWRR
jgi:hypothetical protein